MRNNTIPVTRTSRHAEHAHRELKPMGRTHSRLDDLGRHADSELARSKPLIAAIARELWKLHGGNEVLNWLEAEILLQNALAGDADDHHDHGSMP